MTGLPNSSTAYVEQKKITQYLLNLAHKEGGPKARFFLSHGFTVEDWKGLHDALVAQGQGNPVVKVVESGFGKRYTVQCKCPAPSQKDPCIRSVWEIQTAGSPPRLITAHPV